MTLFSGFAVYFIIWWVTLFAVLPFGMKTQEEDGDVTLGTTESAPARPRLVRTIILTTVVAAIIFGVYFLITTVAGLSFDSIPRMVPEFR